MRKGVFAPYTKAQAVKIIRKYFNLTIAQAESEIERLSACVIRDGLNANKYLYTWETKTQQGLKGNIQELHNLYPFNQVQQTISRETVIQSFRRVYSERDIEFNICQMLPRVGIVEACFPDGIFYFVVSENSVSSAYRTIEDVKRSISETGG